jgi:diacylglycerol kinase (ATP)
MFVVNPKARGGKTRNNWETWEKIIERNLSVPYDYTWADGIGIGTAVTKDAIQEGYNTIVGVGGEGTINEVINGILPKNIGVTLGFIRAGTVNDFLSPIVYDWPGPIEDQLAAIDRGKTWVAPLGKVEADSTRYSLNMANAGIGAEVSYDASIKGRLRWVHGGLRYYLLALLKVAGWKNNPATIKFDDVEVEGDLTLFMSGYSRQGGGFITIPQAELFDRKMGYLFVRDFSRLKILKFLNTVKRGEHDPSIEGIHMGHARKITIQAERPILFEVDGEPFSYHTNQISVEAIDEGITIIDHRQNEIS